MFLPSEFWSPEKIGLIAKAAVILHNMIVERRCSSYRGEGVGGNRDTFNDYTDDVDIVLERVEDMSFYDSCFIQRTTSDDTKLRAYHLKLTNSLVEHIWQIHGDTSV